MASQITLTTEQLKQLIKEERYEEREACAKIADSFWDVKTPAPQSLKRMRGDLVADGMARLIAAAIRRRS